MSLCDRNFSHLVRYYVTDPRLPSTDGVIFLCRIFCVRALQLGSSDRPADETSKYKTTRCMRPASQLASPPRGASSTAAMPAAWTSHSDAKNSRQRYGAEVFGFGRVRSAVTVHSTVSAGVLVRSKVHTVNHGRHFSCSWLNCLSQKSTKSHY